MDRIPRILLGSALLLGALEASARGRTPPLGDEERSPLPLLLVPGFPAGPTEFGFGVVDDLCPDCHTTGRIPFELPRDARKYEGRSLRCTEIDGDPDLNYGIEFLPCPKCKVPLLKAQVEEEYEREKEQRLQWVEGRREVDRFLDDKRLVLMHCSTEHLDLAWSIPEVKVGRRVLRQHESMHLYADRLEEAYLEYLETFGLDHEADQHAVRHHIYCFEMARHSQRAQPQYTGIGGFNAAGAKLVGPNSVFVCNWDKNENRDDDEFYEYLQHNAVHLFLAAFYNYTWLAHEHGWVDAGVSHYFTERRFGKCRTHCFEEQDAMNRWELDPWKPAVRKRVIAKKIPVFMDTARKKTELLDSEEHLFAFSWTQFLIDGHPKEQFVTFLKALKDKKETRDALREAYGYTPFSFIEKWQEYVIDTYPAR